MEEEVNQEGAFVKLSGLIWTATEDDIKGFLKGVHITDVVLTTNEFGKASGDAFVQLASNGEVEKAMAYDKKFLGKRFVVIEKIEKDAFIRETGKEVAQQNEKEKPGSNNSSK